MKKEKESVLKRVRERRERERERERAYEGEKVSVKEREGETTMKRARNSGEESPPVSMALKYVTPILKKFANLP